jgi:hypothetical protein
LLKMNKLSIHSKTYTKKLQSMSIKREIPVNRISVFLVRGWIILSSNEQFRTGKKKIHSV